jgi:peptidoglycan L-alanyl-D-glutamate endopeptidase CwlK
MGFNLSMRSMDRMRRVHPRLIAVVVVALSRSTVDAGITEEQSRTLDEQRAKVEAGVSKTMASKHMIREGASFSTAVDLVPFVDGRFQWGDANWRIRRSNGSSVDAFFIVAEAMRAAAVATGIRIRWGGVWDRVLNNLPAGPDALRLAVEEYKRRHPGPDFLDAPHFELLD